jgi:HPt (histidine-containing phosphotransfer) domain-containing protein
MRREATAGARMASDDIGSELEAFNADYRRSLPQRVGELDALWADLRHGPVTRERMHLLLRRLHAIAGSAGTFGLPRLSEAGAAAEDFIGPFCERACLPDRAERERFEILLAEVRQAAG